MYQLSSPITYHIVTLWKILCLSLARPSSTRTGQQTSGIFFLPSLKAWLRKMWLLKIHTQVFMFSCSAFYLQDYIHKLQLLPILFLVFYVVLLCLNARIPTRFELGEGGGQMKVLANSPERSLTTQLIVKIWRVNIYLWRLTYLDG